MAFGAGLLPSMVVGSTRTERQAFRQVQDELEPIQAQAKESARSVASSVQDAARGAVHELASDASERAGHVTEAAGSQPDLR